MLLNKVGEDSTKNINYIAKPSNVHLSLLYKEFGNIYVDRSGLYNDDNINILTPFPEKPSTVPTLEEAITDAVERVKYFVSQSKKIILLFSGGLDSTLVLSSLIKHNVPVTVTINKETFKEFPELVFDIKNDKYSNVSWIPLNKAFEIDDENIMYLTGELGDQIVGTDRILPYYPDNIDYLKEPAEVFYNNLKYRPNEKVLRDTSAPYTELKTVFDVLWWLNFNFKYQKVQIRTLHMGCNPFENTLHFFDTTKFNQYSLYTERFIPETLLDYKIQYKRLIKEYIGYNQHIDDKKKEPSLKEVLYINK